MARSHKKSSSSAQTNPAEAAFREGHSRVFSHPLFAPMKFWAHIDRRDGNECPEDGYAVVDSEGTIHLHPRRRLEASEWEYVIAHSLLHLGLGHFAEPKEDPQAWNVACDCFVARMLHGMKFGTPPEGILGSPVFQARSEEDLYNRLRERGTPENLRSFGTTPSNHPDMIWKKKGEKSNRNRWRGEPKWEERFAQGIVAAVSSAVRVAAGYESALGAADEKKSAAHKARSWFISSYPLLGALASRFKIIEDPILCARLDISVAAVDAYMGEIYMNPAAGLDEEECRFVMAHELLHVALRHQARRRGRDPFLWNAAADFVINQWLLEMKVGVMPKLGVLYDPSLRGESAESVYDVLVTDMRRNRKLMTLRGVGLGDMLEREHGEWWLYGDGQDLDSFYRSALSQGFQYHIEQGRGFLPGDLAEEIRAIEQPEISWDVELARWFENYFPPVEKTRSYFRPSRRQASTPDIPRPRYVSPAEGAWGRTFGVVLDTSLSMDRQLLGKALGTITRYAIAHEVPAIRVIYCDARSYDAGFLPPESLEGEVTVRGRGGTVLQPAIDLLENAADFPDEGPILILTDGACDRLKINRAHAFVMPEGANLPFPPRGPVFRMK